MMKNKYILNPFFCFVILAFAFSCQNNKANECMESAKPVINEDLSSITEENYPEVDIYRLADELKRLSKHNTSKRLEVKDSADYYVVYVTYHDDKKYRTEFRKINDKILVRKREYALTAPNKKEIEIIVYKTDSIFYGMNITAIQDTSLHLDSVSFSSITTKYRDIHYSCIVNLTKNLTLDYKFKINCDDSMVTQYRYQNGYRYSYEYNFENVKNIVERRDTVKIEKYPHYPDFYLILNKDDYSPGDYNEPKESKYK